MTITQPTDNTLLVMLNNTRVTLSNAIDASQTSIAVSDISKFSATGGYASIYSSHSTQYGTEVISYTGVSGSTLIGVVRGVEASLAARSALAADPIVGAYVAQHHNALRSSIQALAAEVEDLRTGVDVFTNVDVLKVGAVTDGCEVIVDTTIGGVRFEYNKGGAGSNDLDFGPSISTDEVGLKLAGDLEHVAVAATQFRVYTKGNMEGGSELGCFMEPGVVDDASAVGFNFKAINDLTNTSAQLLRVQNQAASVFAVYKVKTEAVAFHATSTVLAPFNAPTFTVSLGTPVNGDVWITNISSVRKLNAHISGVTYSVTLT
ncbi:MAG: hypothetical protein ACI88C_000042 [Acidimicrobiales bacterium]|jgi:hypothetical protein